jgi:hypothetical protein
VPLIPTQPGRSGPGGSGYRADPDGRMRLDPEGRTRPDPVISRTSSPWLTGRRDRAFLAVAHPGPVGPGLIGYREDDESSSSELAVRMAPPSPFLLTRHGRRPPGGMPRIAGMLRHRTWCYPTAVPSEMGGWLFSDRLLQFHPNGAGGTVNHLICSGNVSLSYDGRRTRDERLIP